MRILLQAKHRYPASLGGPGGGRVFDWLAKGLAELGHQVFYFLPPQLQPDNVDTLMPSGVCYCPQMREDVDIFHIRSDSEWANILNEQQRPWVATCHTDPAVWHKSRDVATDEWISVSKKLATSLGKSRFVHNGIDPKELLFKANKQQYLLFAATLRLAEKKGLNEAIYIAKQCGKTLYVAGSDPDPNLTAHIKNLVERAGMKFLGEICGVRKADIFANAAAFIFPTQINEAFGLVLAEALMSGTPVICSDNGACAEVVTADVGFVCRDLTQYIDAVTHLYKIDPRVCRSRAMEKFHYLLMARQYLQYYQEQIDQQANSNCHVKT